MYKNCTQCDAQINESNQVCYGYRNGNARIRSICKPCRSKESMQWAKKHNEKRKIYMRQYVRKIGKVKEYPCLKCGKLCKKKYKFSFCSDICRFMNYVLKTASCWIWKGGRNSQGYGKFMMNGELVVASRASYEFFNGPITEGKNICHVCDNPPCVNPGHLWEGTNSENQIDSINKGRHRWNRKKLEK